MKKLSIFNLISAVILILNLFIFHSPILGIIFGLGFIILSSYLLNRNWLIGFLYFLCFLIIPLTLIYYVWELNNWVITGWLILFIIFVLFKNKVLDAGFIACTPKKYFVREQVGIPAPNKKFYLILIYFVLLIISYLILKSGATTEPVRTPWFFVSKWFFVLYFLTTAWLLFIFKNLKSWCRVVLVSIHFFFSFSIANIIFPLGFGFDPFIHSATQKFILEHGFILPKKLYYIGQYSLVFWLTRILQISQNFINTNLVPALSAILIPSSIYYAFKNTRIQEYKNRAANFFLYYCAPVFLFLFIPFAFLTFTTPQNLGYLLVLALIFISLKFDKLKLIDYLLPITILMIHPIAGIAAVVFTLARVLNSLKLKQWFKVLLYGISCFASIIVFGLFKLVTNFEVNFVNNFNLRSFFGNSFRFFPGLCWRWDVVHIAKTIMYFLWQPVTIFVVLLILSILYLIKNKDKGIYFITFIILFINSLLLYSFVEFPFLIDYERGDFAYRIFLLAGFFLIPFALSLVVQSFGQKTKDCALDSCLRRNDKVGRAWCFVLIILLAGGVTTSLYMSYPRQDVYDFNKGFNVSKYDINAIEYLEEITDEDYVVLANQQVGAAALQEFGFRYFDNKYFFYSIPTSGELYKIYWNIVYQDAGREEIKKAAELTGAKTIYVYFPDYWFNLKLMRKNLTSQADKVLELDGGVVFEFRY